MPYFKRREPEVVEAYRLPQKGENPSDGLLFFMGKYDRDLLFFADYPGHWVARRQDGVWWTMGHEFFLAAYKPLE